MHQSGHSRAHSMQTVQFSSRSAITPRLRGGRSGSTSGYCWVVDRLVIVLSVTARPWTRPLPGAPRSPSSLTNTYPAPSGDVKRAHPPQSLSWLAQDLHDGGQGQLEQSDRHEHQPAEPLQLILAEPGIADPEPDDHERDGEDLQQRPQPAELVGQRAV